MADFKATSLGDSCSAGFGWERPLIKGRIQLPELERRKLLPDTVRFINAPPGSPYAPTADEEASVIGPSGAVSSFGATGASGSAAETSWRSFPDL